MIHRNLNFKLRGDFLPGRTFVYEHQESKTFIVFRLTLHSPLLAGWHLSSYIHEWVRTSLTDYVNLSKKRPTSLEEHSSECGWRELLKTEDLPWGILLPKWRKGETKKEGSTSVSLEGRQPSSSPWVLSSASSTGSPAFRLQLPEGAAGLPLDPSDLQHWHRPSAFSHVCLYGWPR